MTESPANTIRAYLDQNAGVTRVPFHNLLTTWRFVEAGEAERVRIQDELADAGVEVDPALWELRAEDEVTLRIAPAAGDAEELPPWTVEQSAVEPDEELPQPPELPRPPQHRGLGQTIRRLRRDRRNLPAEELPQPSRRGRARPIRALWRDHPTLSAAALLVLSSGAAAGLGYLVGKAF